MEFEKVNVEALAKALADVEFKRTTSYNRFEDIYEEEVNEDGGFCRRSFVLREKYQDVYDKILDKYITLIFEYSED